jgi:hypothetical protein
MITAIVILSILVGLLGYTTYINYKRYAKAVEYAENGFFVYNSFIVNLYVKFRDTLGAMKAADARGSFQADDEVGVTFQYLKEQIDDLDEFIKKYVEAKEEVN